MRIKTLTATLTALVLACSLQAKGIGDVLQFKINSNDGFYRLGETVQVKTIVSEVPDIEYDIKLIGNGVEIKPLVKIRTYLQIGTSVIFENNSLPAGSYYVEVANPDDGKDIKRIGFVVDPWSLQPGYEEPADLMKWWKNEIKTMRKMKVKAEEKELDVPAKFKNKVAAWDVTINCVGPKPARLILAEPVNAAPGSLPIIVVLHSAMSDWHVASSLSDACAYAKFTPDGAICIDVNALGVENCQEKDYYAALFKNGGEYFRYSSRVPETKDDYFFKWMFLRDLRALDYACKNPLWDRSHIILIGGSQGGAQGAWLAGVDKRVTAAVLQVPAMWDLGGFNQTGRRATWPRYSVKKADYPQIDDICPYFDGAFMLRHTDADFWVEVGLYDTTCPASNVIAGFNQIPGYKEIHPVQRAHGTRPKDMDQYPINKSRNDFIRKQMKK